MKRFQFRYERLLNYRRQMEEASKLLYQSILHLLQKARHELESLQATKQEAFGRIRTYQQLGQSVRTELLKQEYQSLASLESLEAVKRKEIENLEAQREKAYQEYVRAQRARKILDRLRERRLQQYKVEADREEQAILADVALATFRKQREEVQPQAERVLVKPALIGNVSGR